MAGRQHHLRFRFASVLGAFSLALLGGCAAGPDWGAISRQAAQIRSGCATQHPDSLLAAEQCANGPIRSLYAANGFPDIDVIDAYLAQREAIAARQDSDTISPQEARAEYAQALAQENTLLQQRSASRAQISAATTPLFCDRVGFHSIICN